MTERDIFIAALQRGDPGARRDYLAEACGANGTLRARVEELLGAHDRAASFLEAPPGELGVTADLPTGERAGTVIGPYKLLEPIGEGGFGVVFLAEQIQPVRRKVALKVLKPGMDTRQVVARFEAERQALALMDHPNIAKVLDGGATPTGRPYFVMELVKGVPITEFCDQNHLSPRQRLELFVQVCRAVQHAHQKGIIHRDLKPSNVLVSRHDTTPVVKVIDFGVAKALGQELTDKTLFTGVAQMIGTPLYMSPEQAGMSDLDVDTRSDIYSLGVLLYELLTGTTPFDKERMKGAGYDEIRRIIREEEPPKPSTRLSTVAELATIAANRGSEPRRLSGQVRGELDWLVMKALEKDRNRRYDSANAFAVDVQRYLAGEAVQAVPPSAGYRLRKFARRNRGPVLIASLLVLALGGVVTGTSWGLYRATQAGAEAVKESQQKEAALTTARESKRDADLKLFASYLDQSRALRMSRRPGQRFESLAVVRRATELARTLELPEEKFHELCNVAVAALALPDLYPTGPRHPWPADASLVDADDDHTIYARTDTRGNCSVRRFADDREIHHLSGRGMLAQPYLSRDGKYLAVHHQTGGPSGADIAVELWEIGSTPVRKILSEKSARCPTFNADASRFAVAYSSGAIGVFELPTGRPRKRLPPVTLTQKLGIALHPTEPIVAVCSYFGSVVQLRELETAKVIAELPQDGGALCLTWDAAGRTLAVGLEDNRIRLYDRSTLQLLRTLMSTQAVVWATFNRAGDRLAAIGWGKRVELFDTQSAETLFTTQTASHLEWVRFRRDGQRLMGVVEEGELGSWQVGDAREHRTVASHYVSDQFGKTYSQAVSPNERLIASSMANEIGLTDLNGGRVAHIARSPAGPCLFQPSGALLAPDATGLMRWPVSMTSAESGHLIVGPPGRLPLPFGNVLGQSRDGRVIVSCSRATSIQQPHAGGWILHTDRPDPPIRLDAGADVGWIAISPDGRWVVTTEHSPGATKIWDANDGSLVTKLSDYGAGFPLFSPDSRWLSTRLDGGRLIAVGTWERGPRVGSGVFSPDGRLLAVPKGHQIHLVDLATTRTLATLEDPNLEQVEAIVAFSRDGSTLMSRTTGNNKNLQIWDLRRIRQQLAGMGLDWVAPPYPPEAARTQVSRLKIEVQSDGPSREPGAEADIERFRTALARNPNDARVCNGLAWAYLTAPEALRDVNRALALAEKAVRLVGTSADYRNTLGVAYYRAGRYPDAIRVLRINLEQQQDATLAFDLYFLAMSYQQLGDTVRAKDYLNWAVRWETNQRGLGHRDREELKMFRAEARALFVEIAPPPREKP